MPPTVHRLRRTLALLAWICAGAAQGWAEDDARRLLDAAYARTKTAEQAADYTAILQLCERAGDGRLPDDLAAYRRRLLAWTYNRRGEWWAEQSAASPAPGKRPSTRQCEAQALADFQQALQHDPRHWKALYNRAVSYALLGKYREAIADLRQSLQLKPDHANTHFNLGEVHRELREYARAIEYYDDTLRLDPRDAAAHLGRGRCHEGLDQWAEAVRDYERAVALDPRNASARAWRGNAYQRLGRWEEAALDLREAGRLEADSAEILRMAAWLMATCPDPRFRQADLAVQAAERAVERAVRDDHRYLDTLAAAYANAGRFDDAVRTGRAALDCSPPEQDRPAMRSRLDLYRGRQAYRQPAGAATAAEPARR